MATCMQALMTLLTLAASASSAAAAEAAQSPLTGTWQLVRFENSSPAGVVTKPYGEKPKGYFVYDNTGHLSVQIMATPPVPKFAAVDEGKSDTAAQGTEAEIRKAFSSYVAYFGTWRVNESGTVVTHVVEGALDPSYTDTDQPRPFKLTGDKLVIEIQDPVFGRAYRELRRVR